MEITELLRSGARADASVDEQEFPLIYSELKRIAAGHLRGQWNVTLSATALVHEAFLRVSALEGVVFEHRGHFFGIASRIMRNVLVDLVRHANAQKRGGGLTVQFDDAGDLPDTHSNDVILLDDALNRLAQEHPRQARIIEMRYFGGMTAAESGSLLGVSEATIKRDVRFAQAWLRRELANKPS